MNDRQARAAQCKLNVTSRKMAHYCIPAAQLYVREVTRPSFSWRLKGVACKTRKLMSPSIWLQHAKMAKDFVRHIFTGWIIVKNPDLR